MKGYFNAKKGYFLLIFMVSCEYVYPVFTNDVRRRIFARWEGGRGVLRWIFDYFKITHTVKKTRKSTFLNLTKRMQAKIFQNILILTPYRETK